MGEENTQGEDVTIRNVIRGSFGWALEVMKAYPEHKLTRQGWNGKGMFIFLTQGREVPNNRERSFAHFPEDTVTLASHIDMRASDGTYVSGWLASQTDMLAEDWVIVE